VPIARVCVARFTRAIPQTTSTASQALHATNRLSKFHHGTKLWASQNIFPDSIHNIWSKYGHILGKTLCSGPRLRPGKQAHGGHRPSSSAPCAVPMRLSKDGQHIKDEPCAKQRALLGVFSCRFSSVSRGVRSAVQIYFLYAFSTLVLGWSPIFVYSTIDRLFAHLIFFWNRRWVRKKL
jgi:hypothetical protein